MTAPAVEQPAVRPVLVTVPNVPILSVGTWAASTGTFTCTQDDLHAAVAAFDDPGYTRPRLKLGHTDERFGGDAEPAIGRLINPRLSADGMTLVVDIAGVPAWLADVMATAFPSRSIEGEFKHRTQTGTTHRFALTALSLLGVEAPAVSTLADLATLFGLDAGAVAATAADSLEDSMPEPVAVAASVNLDTVRQQFYAEENAPMRRALGGGWVWVREVYTDFVIVDDDEGHLLKLPWSESTDRPGEVTFGEPSPVRVEYVPQSADVAAKGRGDSLRAGALRARLAAMATDPASADTPADAPPDAPPPDTEPPSTPPDPGGVSISPAAEPEAPATESKETPVSPQSEIRSRLGLPEDADDAAVLAALDGRVGTPATSPTQPDDDGGDTDVDEPAAQPDKELVAAATPQRPAIPEGAVLVEASALEEMKRNARLGAEAHERQRVADRDRFISAAQDAGKFAPARLAHWVKAWEADPEGTQATLESLEPGLVVPVAAAGYTGTGSEQADAISEAEDAEWARHFGIPKGALL